MTNKHKGRKMKEAAKHTDLFLSKHLRLKRRAIKGKPAMAVLAATMGISQNLIGKVENNNRRLDIGEFIYYCHALDLDPVKQLRVVAAY